MTLPTATTTTTQSTPVPVTANPVTMTTATYAGYTYQYGSGTPQPQQQQQQHPYRPSSGTPVPNTAPATYASYKPPYYQYAGAPQPQQSYYGQQQQGYTAAAYSGWYNAYAGSLAVNMNPVTVTGSGSGSAGRGTPQPTQTAVIPTATMNANVNASAPTTYGAFFGNAPTPPAPAQPTGGPLKTPAVANTVNYAGAQPGSGVGGAVPTLPIHLRPGQQLQQPLQQGSYYGAYQPPR